MKKVYILAAFILLSGIAPNSFAQKKEDHGTWFKTGSVLTYHVVNAKKEYNYIVSDLIVDNNIAFNWKMTEPVNYTGSVKIFDHAIDTATIMVNNFENGSSQNMVNKTTVIISRKIFKRILSQSPVKVTLDKTDETLKFVRYDKYPVMIDGTSQEIGVVVVESETGSKFQILNYPQFPLIIKMELGFSIELLSIDTKK